ncbi:MAG TPA: MFS transporter [bacterium]|nr:MFS transporter [bacterium]
MPNTSGNRWRVVLGAILIQFCLGAIYAWSVFTPTLNEAGWSNVQTQAVFSVGLAFFALVMVWAGKRLTKWGPRRLAVIAGLVLGLGYVLAGLIGKTNFWLNTLFIGVIGGSGIGLGYVVPIAVGMRWYPDRKGLITGLAVAGFGFGAMGWIKLAGSWGNLLERTGLSMTFIIYGVLFAALTLLGSIWMVFPADEPKNNPEIKTARDSKALRSHEMVRTGSFYLIFFTFVITAGAGLMSIGLMKLYPMEALQRSGHTAAAASAIAGTAMAVYFSLANGLGRILWGLISDRIGQRPAIILMAVLQGLMMMAMIYTAGQPVLLYASALIIGFNFGGNFSLFPTLTADTFGAAHVGENYPFVFLAYGVGGILMPILGGILGDLGNFPLAFALCGFLCWVGALLIRFIKKPLLKPGV